MSTHVVTCPSQVAFLQDLPNNYKAQTIRIEDSFFAQRKEHYAKIVNENFGRFLFVTHLLLPLAKLLIYEEIASWNFSQNTLEVNFKSSLEKSIAKSQEVFFVFPFELAWYLHHGFSSISFEKSHRVILLGSSIPFEYDFLNFMPYVAPGYVMNIFPSKHSLTETKIGSKSSWQGQELKGKELTLDDQSGSRLIFSLEKAPLPAFLCSLTVQSPKFYKELIDEVSPACFTFLHVLAFFYTLLHPEITYSEYKLPISSAQGNHQPDFLTLEQIEQVKKQEDFVMLAQKVLKEFSATDFEKFTFSTDATKDCKRLVIKIKELSTFKSHNEDIIKKLMLLLKYLF